MKTLLAGLGAIVVLTGGAMAGRDASTARDELATQTTKTSGTKPTVKPEELDQLFAPIALYPDPLLAQMLMAAEDPGMVAALNAWLPKQTLKGTELQDAATKQGFGPSHVALAIFPDVVQKMATQIDKTTKIGAAFAADRSAVFASIQRLRAKAKQMGTLKTNAQQEVETRTTSSGQQVIVIEPANEQVVYVPQYNPQVVYTQPATTTVVIQEEDNSGAAVAAGLIGFTAGIAIGAAIDNDYYYGPYGFYGGGHMYNDAWDDYYDAREDAREDWMDHREDVIEGRSERREDVSANRTERAGTAQEQRTQRQENRTENRPTSEAQQQRRSDAKSAASAQTSTASRSSQESRGDSRGQTATKSRSGTSSDAFSNYSSGKSERAASSRGQKSRSSSSRSSGGRRR